MATKYCPHCKDTKEVSLFNKNKSKKDGLNVFCRECQKKHSKKYYATNGEYHKKYIIKQNIRRRKELKEKVDELKTAGCQLCSEKDVCCLDYHHLRDKDRDIALLVHHAVSFERVLEEIKKCVLVCANCHRKIHAGKLQLNAPPEL